MLDAVGVIVVLLMGIVFIINTVQERIFKKRKIDSLGTAPINKVFFIIGKLTMMYTWVCILLQAFVAGLKLNQRLFPLPAAVEWGSLVILIAGSALVTASYYYLGESNRMGLPAEKTELKTGGIYKYSRNPMYLGFFLIMVFSIIYTMNPITLVMAVVSIIIHHRVILAEENFLKGAFKKDYPKYVKQVRRYI